MITDIHEVTLRNVSFLFIEKMLQHEKCAYFSEEQKERVRKAYELADTLHLSQERHNNTPYIYHIDRSVKIYLTQTLHEWELCDPRYLIWLILHDCIEDNDNWLIEIIKKNFGISIIVDILFMSKPTRRVISQVMKIKQTHEEIYQQLQLVWLIQLYVLILENNPEKFIKNLQPDESISKEMHKKLVILWNNTYKKKYLFEKDLAHKHKIYAEFIFLSLISCMQPNLFRIKATERRDNMQDIDGLGILENSVWLKVGVFGIIEPNTPLFLTRWLKVL